MNCFVKPILSVALLLGLAACGDGTRTEHYIIDPPVSNQASGDMLGATELRDVSLPEYAAGTEMAWQSLDGAVRTSSRVLWADNPQRAFTLTLARAISDVSGATVIPEPWPMATPAQRRLDVRIEKALASNDGFFRLQGRYFLSDEGGGGGQDHARNFDIAVPVNDDTPQAVANAASIAITLLAEQIAVLGGSGSTIVAQPSGGGGADPFADLPPLF
ncbi:MAG: PqiC family protein [Paracoccus sp. (in: a-proteobacteria)]|nr:PqiC family protein [Paracoccus sp. (in: a-proteobacteria)]